MWQGEQGQGQVEERAEEEGVVQGGGQHAPRGRGGEGGGGVEGGGKGRSG